jgi:hypothetical protein
MKKFILFTFLFCVFASICFAQKSQTPSKPRLSEPLIVTEFSDADWKILTDALRAEDWKTAAPLAALYLQRLKIDNDKKQLAQLRYFYLYALAGKILAADSSSSAKIPIESDSLWKELDTAVGNFIGKEFVLPPRRLMPECNAVLNFICPVKDSDQALRVTATNREGTLIHSFDYVTFDKKIVLDEHQGKETFLGGRLKRAEFNQDTSKPWVMRLIFEAGFVRVVEPDGK